MSNIKEYVKQDDEGLRVDRWFKRNFPDVPFVHIANLVRKSAITLDSKSTSLNARLRVNQQIEFPPFIRVMSKITRPKISLNPLQKRLSKVLVASVLYKDNDLLVINKPPGLAVQGGTKINCCIDDISETLKFGLETKPLIVHRLDKDTSGVLLLARTVGAAAALSKLLREKQIQKDYLAIVYGTPSLSAGRIESDIPLKCSNQNSHAIQISKQQSISAITDYAVLSSVPNMTLLKMSPITGRTHQLRIHCTHIGCAIIGDSKYCIPTIKCKDKTSILQHQNSKHLHLHAWQITFDIQGKRIQVKAPPPLYFQQTLHQYFSTFDITSSYTNMI